MLIKCIQLIHQGCNGSSFHRMSGHITVTNLISIDYSYTTIQNPLLFPVTVEYVDAHQVNNKVGDSNPNSQYFVVIVV